MDPLSLAIGFGRALVPPQAMPQATQVRYDAVSDLGLDGQHMKRIGQTLASHQAGSGVQQQKQQSGQAAKPGQAAQPGQQGQTVGSPSQGQQAQQVREKPGLDAAEALQLADPLYANRLKAIYGDRLTVTHRSPSERLQAFLAAPIEPLDFSLF